MQQTKILYELIIKVINDLKHIRKFSFSHKQKIFNIEGCSMEFSMYVRIFEYRVKNHKPLYNHTLVANNI